MRSPLIEPNRTPQLRKLAFKIINSTTILLPAWYDVLASLKLPQRNMPRDVPTRWNSTYDMLRFALKYEKAIKNMTQARELGLRIYELSPEEWILAQQLADVLEVCPLHQINANSALYFTVAALSAASTCCGPHQHRHDAAQTADSLACTPFGDSFYHC